MLVPIEIASDGLTDLATHIAHTQLGESLVAEWAIDTATNIVDPLLRGRGGAARHRPDRRPGRRRPASTLVPTEPMIAASIFSDFWNDQILAEEKQGLFLVLVGFILSFAFIRMPRA